MKFKKKNVLAGLNTSTGHWTMPCENSSYVRLRLLHDGHSCTAWSFCRLLKTQKHSVSKSLFCSGFSFFKHFNRKIYLCSFFFNIQNRERCLSKKILYKSLWSFCRLLKTQKHSVSKSLFCSGFSFFKHFNRKIYLCSFFFNIQNRERCLSKKILYNSLLFFGPALDSFSSENILYVIIWH